MKLKMIYINKFKSVFKDLNYYIYQFIDANSLTLLTYSTTKNIDDKLIEGKSYEVCLEIKGNRLRIKDINLD